MSLIAGGAQDEGLSLRDRIDAEIERRWEGAGVAPAAPAGEHEFFRRVHLDLLGRLPRPDEIRAHVAGPEEGRRERIVDRLLGSEEAAHHWAERWTRILLTSQFREGDILSVDFASFQEWLKRSYLENLPYDRWVTALIAAKGEKAEHPEANFLAKYVYGNQSPIDLVNRVAQVFLGMEIRCAQCHDHPADRWTQDDYWGLAAFFGNLKVRSRKTFDGVRAKLVQERPVEIRVTTILEEDRSVRPRFLDGRVPDKGADVREALAEYLGTMEGNALAKAFINREWALFMGRGLVEPVGRMNSRSVASHPELWEGLARDFAGNGYDVRSFRRAVLLSRPYQLSCRPVPEAGPELFASRLIRAQGPIEFLNSFEYALELGVFFEQFYRQFKENPVFPQGSVSRALFRVFLTQFISGLLSSADGSADEGGAAGSTLLALKLMNNHDLQGAARAGWGHLRRTLELHPGAEERLEELFLTLFSRPPDEAEKARYLEYLRRKKGRAEAYEDIFWVLLNSPDFLFNH